ncbi:uncharacterized protein l(1)G0289 isoform X2 [Panulirus ornatus]|uniref:uncharacterized protein l(1)G0289 isoform X2 n=1 Tax=Panulirus ornatus TaxID=150431 RepID=UPI003A83DFF3
MAAMWLSVVSFLVVLVLFVINTSQAHISDTDYNFYAVFGDDAQETDYLEFRPLVRLRRDEYSYNTEDKLKDVKSADPLKNSKGDKIPPKTDTKKKIPPLKKDALATKSLTSSTTEPTVETLSDIVSVSNSTPGAIPVTSSTTTTSTSSPVPSNETEANLEENRTGGLTDSKNSTEEETDDTTSTPATANVTVVEDTTLEEEVTSIQDDEDDPDSGDDTISPITGFNTDNTTVDHHRYYRSYTYTGMQEAQQYWVDLDSYEEEKVVTNELLSASHRRAATVSLTFEFPFYGHMLKNITIATGGFLFTGNFVHTWLAATQYIAPLMANFDTSLSKNASVKYADNGTSFTVQWNNVLLKDHEDAGTFTFQATLHKNGDIVFTYKQVPVIVSAIGDTQHPVKVGLSDAYIVDRIIFFVRRKTIYEYHKIDKKNSMIGNWTAILFKALPTCVSITNCNDCLSQKISFQCQWCSIIGRCSSGLDRHRQEWLHNDCEGLHIRSADDCHEAAVIPTTVDTFGHDASVEPYSTGSESSSATNNTSSRGSNLPNQDTSASLPTPDIPPGPTNASAYSSTHNITNTSSQDTSGPTFNEMPSSPTHSSSLPSSPVSSPYPLSTNPIPMTSPTTSSAMDASDNSKVIVSDGEPDALARTSGRDVEESGTSVGTVVGVVFLIALVLGIAGWLTYAYFFPHSTSGQIIIRYRPSTWSWKRGEARYTAAAIHSIHM